MNIGARYFAQRAAVPAVGSAARKARDIAQLLHILNFCRPIKWGRQKLRICRGALGRNIAL